MEAVAALRQHTDLVAGGELRQADRALRRGHPLAPVAGTGTGAVAGDIGEFWERVEDLFLEAAVGEGLARRGSSGAGGGATAEPGAACDGDEADDADEGAEQRRQDDHEVGLDGGCLRRRHGGINGGGGGVFGGGGLEDS